MFIKDRSFYKKVLTIAIPITLQSLITFAINMMDTVMVGSLGEIPLSAASLSGQIFFITTILCFGIGGGGAVLTSQFWGKNDKETPLWMGKKMHELISQSSLIVFKDGDHFAYYQEYARFCFIVKEFLEGLDL